MAALYGGGLVAWLYGGMSPTIFMARLQEAVSVTHFEVGMIKAPFMALVDRHRRMREGLEVQGQRRIARAADHGLGREVDLSGHRARRPVRHLLRLDRDVNAWPTRQTPAISVRDLSVGFGEKNVLDHLSLDVRRGEILGLVGGSGSGKSVLLRTIIGLMPKREGHIEVLGVDTRHGRQRRRHADRAPLGHPVPAGRAVFLADRPAERAVSDARESRTLGDVCCDEWRLPSSKWSGLTPDDGDKFPPSCRVE